eukprot:512485-Pyramimonas_sp.AAC.2
MAQDGAGVLLLDSGERACGGGSEAVLGAALGRAGVGELPPARHHGALGVRRVAGGGHPAQPVGGVGDARAKARAGGGGGQGGGAPVGLRRQPPPRAPGQGW